jgi:hypothetical protein
MTKEVRYGSKFNFPLSATVGTTLLKFVRTVEISREEKKDEKRTLNFI